MKAGNFFSYFLGALFVLGGLVFFGFSMDWWTFNIGFENWWTLCVGGAGLLLMFIFGVDIFNSLVYFAGLGLILYENGYVAEENRWVLFITMAIMAVGVSLTGIAYKRYSPFEKRPKAVNRINPKITAFATKKHITNAFNGVGGGKVSNFKSDIVYDISEAIVDDGTKLDIKTTLGKTYLILPAGYDIVLDVKGKVLNQLTASDPNGRKIEVCGKVNLGKLYIMNPKAETVIPEFEEKKA